jgi:ABC-type glutathione transport system ATPase component
MSAPILTARAISKRFGEEHWFKPKSKARFSVDRVDVEINEGETLAIVGESGSGKSTLARMLLNMISPTSGEVLFFGRSLSTFDRNDWISFRKAVQPIFQDPASSLNPRMRVETTLAHVLRRHGMVEPATLDSTIVEILSSVGLDAAIFRSRYPHQLSGGQQQRIAIARAIAIQPKLIIADEPLSSLDMSVQAQILRLLEDLKAARNLSLILISHDLNLVDAIADRVIVMCLGQAVESGPTRQVLGNPANEYTRSLIAAKLVADPRRARRRPVPVAFYGSQAEPK